jgi:DNA-binding transcriptional LysR family regulator
MPIGLRHLDLDRMENELVRFRQIVAVAQSGSFTRAAETLRISQPALSRSIKAFEAHHRVRLFDRGSKGAVPTAIGRPVIAQAEAILRSLRDLEHNVALLGGGGAGRVRFGINPMMASILLPRLGRRILAERPGVQLDALIMSPDRLITPLLDDEIELLFGNEVLISRIPGTTCVPLGTLRLGALVRSAHPLASQRRISTAEIEGFPIASEIALPVGGIDGIHGAFICENLHILREITLGSDCVWLTSPLAAADDIRNGRMAELDLADPHLSVARLCVAFKRGRTQSPLARSLVQQIQDDLMP